MRIRGPDRRNAASKGNGGKRIAGEKWFFVGYRTGHGGILILPVDRNAGSCLVKGSTCAPLHTSVPLRDPPQEPAKKQNVRTSESLLRTVIYLVAFSLLAVTDLDTWLASSRTRAILEPPWLGAASTLILAKLLMHGTAQCTANLGVRSLLELAS